MSVFPLNIETKEDFPGKLNSLQDVDSKYYSTAEEKNKVRDGLTENKDAIDSISQGLGTIYETRALAVTALANNAALNGKPFVVYAEANFNGQYRFDNTVPADYVLIQEYLKKAVAIEVGNTNVAVSGDVANADIVLQDNINLKANQSDFEEAVGISDLEWRQVLSVDNTDNTSDANKPISTAQQTALNLKAPIASPTFTGVLTTPELKFSTGFGYSIVDEGAFEGATIYNSDKSAKVSFYLDSQTNAVDIDTNKASGYYFKQPINVVGDVQGNTITKFGATGDDILMGDGSTSSLVAKANQSVIEMLFEGIGLCKTMTQLSFYIRGGLDNCTIESIQCVQEF
tara:strand:- start:2363 stop:3391 length:1029 start_codon:yes stop_codon:yes gene_type:complete